MSTNQQIKAASQRCAYLVRLIEEAGLSSDRQRSLVLYNMAHVESDTVSRELDSLLFQKRPAYKICRTRAA
jgi:hypothetical protein